MLLCYSMGGIRLGQLGGELKYCDIVRKGLIALQLVSSLQVDNDITWVCLRR